MEAPVRGARITEMDLPEVALGHFFEMGGGFRLPAVLALHLCSPPLSLGWIDLQHAVFDPASGIGKPSQLFIMGDHHPGLPMRSGDSIHELMQTPGRRRVEIAGGLIR